DHSYYRYVHSSLHDALPIFVRIVALVHSAVQGRGIAGNSLEADGIIPVVGHLPNVSDHVIEAIIVGRKTFDGSGSQETVFSFVRSEEHTSELQSRENLVCRL